MPDTYTRGTNRRSVALASYDNSWYSPGGNIFKRTLWYYVNIFFFINPFNPISVIKVLLLRLFGARVGTGVTIKPAVNIKYPWLLEIGNHVWIGEEVWIDNLATVHIEDNVSISQGAMLLTGSHDYKKPTFDLLIGKILIEEGAWIGAKAIVCPSVICGTHSVLAAGSIATTSLESYTIYQGNPALPKRKRVII